MFEKFVDQVGVIESKRIINRMEWILDDRNNSMDTALSTYLIIERTPTLSTLVLLNIYRAAMLKKLSNLEAFHYSRGYPRF